MASPFTRSSRRSEGLTTRSSTRNNVSNNVNGHHVATISILPGSTLKPQQQQQQHHHHPASNIGRKKRPREATDRELEESFAISKKRAKIEIEIPIPTKKITLLPPPPTTRPVNTTTTAQATTQTTQPAKLHAVELQIKEKKATPKPTGTTTHHDKVVNGIKHELDRLQQPGLGVDSGVNVGELRDEKRKLRSQEGTRFKSELSAYFPEYDEVIGNEPKEDHILNLDTKILIIDSAKNATTTNKHKTSSPEYPVRDFPDTLFYDLHNAQRVDLSFLDASHADEDEWEDPLSDEYFETIHKKPGRAEKTLRNTDKGRAQHEKDQVIRLLEGLQGPEWLKLMGVSGVTDSKKKEYEPARDHFIHGCQAIIEKFRIWREEEKKRKLEKEAAMAEADEEEEEEEEEEEDIEEEGASEISDGDPPDYSDVDASAARQLHEEAIARSAPHHRPGRRSKIQPLPAPILPHEIERDFTSFFAKPHLREAALGKHRRSGRSAAAWGHPVPEVPQRDFDLPCEYRDEETLKAHARRKRRDRRVSKS